VRLCVCDWVCARAHGRVHMPARVLLYLSSVQLAFVASLAPPYFSTLSHKLHDFRETVIEHSMCVLTFYTTYIQKISDFKNNLARYVHKCEYIFK
jgi:hypothetical protein